ncbi:MAG: hypothetical protein H6565_04965 [Lewinellaceae bacterium]|nr:hypothetical protein [Lewinellaceae bacterium]
MENAFTGFEKILWLLYRVISVLIPPIFFVISVLMFIFAFDEHEIIIKYVQSVQSNLGFFSVIIPFAFVFSFFIEALSNAIYKFSDGITSEFEKSPYFNAVLKDIDARINKELMNIEGVKTTGIETYSSIGARHFYLLRLHIFKEEPAIGNYIWFLYSNYKVVASISICTFFAAIIMPPFGICAYYNTGFSMYITLQLLQLFLCSVIMHFSVKQAKDKAKDTKDRLTYGMVYGPLLIGLSFVVCGLYLVKISIAISIIMFLIGMDFMIYWILRILSYWAYYQYKVHTSAVGAIIVNSRFNRIFASKFDKHETN